MVEVEEFKGLRTLMGEGCVLSVTLKLNAVLLSIMFVSSTLQYKQNL